MTSFSLERLFVKVQSSRQMYHLSPSSTLHPHQVFPFLDIDDSELRRTPDLDERGGDNTIEVLSAINTLTEAECESHII
jgi:hypothetical protein